MIRVFVGFDSRESAAFWIAKHSLERHASVPVKVYPLVQQLLRMGGLYGREADPLASTEFTYTRFLVPYLANYQGWALYMDGDMLARDDVADLWALADCDYAVMCVKHEHVPADEIKAGNRRQTLYPRKNWSSLMLINCQHKACRALTPRVVSSETGAYLHQFKWLEDKLIGELPVEWNWLEGWSSRDETPNPKIVHFTRGIPGIHEGYSRVAFADEYLGEARVAAAAQLEKP